MNAPDERSEFDARVLDFLAAGLTRREPPGGLRSRLLARAAGPERFTPFVDRLMGLVDLPESATREKLAMISTPKAWVDAFPGVRYRDFDGGPALAGVHAGLVRMAPGSVFPHHTHVGEERVLMLQGEVVDDQGKLMRAGDLVIGAAGSSHELTVVGDEEVIYAAVVENITLRDFPDFVI